MHIYTLVHGCIVAGNPIPLPCTCQPYPSAARHGLFLAISHGLPQGIGCARCLGRLPSGHGLGGDYDVFELVLGDDVDGICVCGGQCCLRSSMCRGRTNANDQGADGEASDGVLHEVWRTSAQQGR
jgi:hypothetical protein